MPYKPFLEGGKQAVYAVDASGKKMGKRRGLHDTLAEAKAQIAAIMASEKPKKELASFDSATTFVDGEEVSITPTPTDDETLKELHTKMGYYEAEMMPMAGPCSFEEMDAMEAAEETAEKMQDMTYKFQMMAGNVMRNPAIEDKAQALVDLAGEFASRIKKPIDDDKAINIAKQIAGDNQPESKPNSTSQTTGQTPDSPNDPGGDSGKSTDTQSLFIWKENDQYYCLLAYSNNRRDEDNPPEIIASESHKEFDEALTKGEWPMPELWLWHVNYPVGKTIYHAYDESAGFPIALATFDKDKNEIAEALLKAEGWDGVSHGMPSEWIQRDPNDPTIIVRHRTKEISILPRWAAANKLAFNVISKESGMSEETKGLPAHKRPDFVKLLGEEQTKQVEATLDNTSKEADEAGIESKEQAQPPEPVTGVTHKEIAEVLAVIKETFEKFDNRLKAMEEQKTTEEKEAESFDLVALLKEKSAIGKAENKVDGRSAFAKDAPEEAQPESYTERFSGMRVSLVDQLVGANQAYYENRR